MRERKTEGRNYKKEKEKNLHLKILPVMNLCEVYYFISTCSCHFLPMESVPYSKLYEYDLYRDISEALSFIYYYYYHHSF